ncbi:MAG TPA: hypothetical protein PLN68_09990, partial [Elusimicrobiales bacterium]|nr:hypothetical protein [Elusimicrobiales bacterium]
FLSLVSSILKYGVVSFIILSFLAYLFKPISFSLYKKLLDTAVFILIITPILRISMISYGFYRLNEKRYSFYAITILVLLFLGVVIK